MEDSIMSCEDMAQDMSITSVPLEHASITLNQFSTLLESKFVDMETKLTSNFKSEINMAINGLKKELNETTDFLFSQFTDFKNELATYRERINNLESENTSLHLKLSQLCKQQPTSQETVNMHATIKQLQLELNQRDQAGLLNDVEVSGIPEFDGESASHIAITLANKLGISLDERDIVYARRVGSKRRLTTDATNYDLDVNNRVRPLCISFSRRSLRDDFLKNARVRRGTTTTDLGLPNHDARRVHIHERLTQKNRVIFGKARSMGKALQWRYIWSREGRVFARRTDSSIIHRLQTEEDIDRVFKMHSDPPSSS
ncbi:unnamed protein product [Colias eurytheme]|nr:unnamed protein product [Colias eurytheme]